MPGRHKQGRTENPPLPDYAGNVVQSKRYSNVLYSGFSDEGIRRVEATADQRKEWDDFEPGLNSGRHRAGDAPHPTLRTRLGLSPKVASQPEE